MYANKSYLLDVDHLRDSIDM